jgi:menaquinol-cytochrome c reductase iron-sulfur subunit
MSSSHQVNRRDFVRVVTAFLGTVMGVVIGLPAIGYILAPALKKQASEAWIPAGPLENYAVGEPALFNFTRSKINGWEKTTNSYGVYIVRGEGDSILALSNVCTHLSCRVSWKAEENMYVCPCHAGYFDIEGGIIDGPQPRPLDAYETKVEEGTLFIHYVEG